MSFKCKIGIHNWEHCTCKDCNTVRNDHHDLSKDCEKCAKCGAEIPDNHNWDTDCEKCSKCGKTRDNGHSWKYNCEKCSTCGKTRTDKHQTVNGICSVCGHGKYKDSDGKQYNIIQIGDQVVMAENYAKKPESGSFWMYEDDHSKLVKYGYLYDFQTAKEIAPEGWHIPTKEEWDKMYHELGTHFKDVYESLKITGHSGFDALFGGWRYVRGTYNGENASAHYWTDSEVDENEMWHFKIGAYHHKYEFEKGDKKLGMSVRYFKNK